MTDQEQAIWNAVRTLQLEYRGLLKTSHALMIVKHQTLKEIEELQGSTRGGYSSSSWWKSLLAEGIGQWSYYSTKDLFDSLIATAEASGN